jgi:aryl-alcohol dehydrogenase-like predicted oxidoreductase
VKLQEAVSEYVKIAKKHNLSPVELALGFCRDRSFVTSSIIGATSMEQLKENIDAFTTTRPLSEEVNADIDAVFNRYRDPAIV